MEVEWAWRGERARLQLFQQGCGGGGWMLGPEKSSPSPLEWRRNISLTMMIRLSPGSTVTGDDKYGGFKASAPNVPFLGLCHCPSHLRDSQLLKHTGPSSNPNFWFIWPKSVAATSNRGRNPIWEELNSKRVFACPFRS